MSLDRITVDEMSLDRMTVDEMSLDRMTVYEMSLDRMTLDEMSLDKMTVAEVICCQLQCSFSAVLRRFYLLKLIKKNSFYTELF